MMKNKKKRKNLFILGIILAIAFLIIIWQLGGFDSFLSAEIIPLGTFTQNSPFVCTNASYCNVQGTLYCDTKHTGNAIVTFRTNAYQSSEYDNDGTWFAINGVPSGSSLIKTSSLSGYCRTSSFSSCVGSIVGYTKTNDKIYAYNSEFRVETSGHCRRYSSTCPSSVLDTNQVAGYETREITEGESSSYSCSGFFTIEDLNQNSLINPVSLSCSSNTNPCSQNYVYPLGVPEDSVVSVTGGDRNEITYQRVIVPECSKNTCENGVLKRCTNGQWDGFVSCEYGCVDGEEECVNPYDIKIQIKDSNGFSRSSFSKNELVKIYATLETPNLITGTLTMEVREGSLQGQSSKTEPMSFQSNIPNIFEFQSSLTNTYYLVFLIDYPQLQEPDIYGIETNEINSFEVVDEFSANLRITQTLGNVQNSNKFYTGYPIKIEYIFKQPGDTPILPDSAKVTYQIGSGSKIELTNPAISQDDFAGYYTYYLAPTQPSTYKFEGTATRGTFTTNPSTQGPYAIEKDSIVIESDLSFNPVQTGKAYSNILKFTTKNRNKELVPTNNIVKVRINGVDSGTVPVFGANGEYSVDYTFAIDNADYLFMIESNPTEGYDLIKGELSTELIKSGSSEDTSCKEDSECGMFSKCVSGTCETNVWLILSIFIGTGVGITIIILIWTFIRNRKKKPRIPGIEDY